MQLFGSLQLVAAMAERAAIDEKIVEQIASLMRTAEETGARISAWEEIQELLMSSGLAWRSKAPPEFVGVHPENRIEDGWDGIPTLTP